MRSCPASGCTGLPAEDERPECVRVAAAAAQLEDSLRPGASAGQARARGTNWDAGSDCSTADTSAAASREHTAAQPPEEEWATGRAEGVPMPNFRMGYPGFALRPRPAGALAADDALGEGGRHALPVAGVTAGRRGPGGSMADTEAQASVLSTPAPPSKGSAGHHLGQCKPCAFMNTKGCESGLDCRFCHLCEPGEKTRRRKEKLHVRRAVREVARLASNGWSNSSFNRWGQGES